MVANVIYSLDKEIKENWDNTSKQIIQVIERNPADEFNELFYGYYFIKQMSYLDALFTSCSLIDEYTAETYKNNLLRLFPKSTHKLIVDSIRFLLKNKYFLKLSETFLVGLYTTFTEKHFNDKSDQRDSLSKIVSFQIYEPIIEKVLINTEAIDSDSKKAANNKRKASCVFAPVYAMIEYKKGFLFRKGTDRIKLLLALNERYGFDYQRPKKGQVDFQTHYDTTINTLKNLLSKNRTSR